jgi:hypothetical protein
MTRPLLLDLYCCSGGAAMGYHRAGFDVIGVDIEPRPRYPFPMIRASALNVLDALIAHRECAGEPDHSLLHRISRRAVAVHASPPCQKDNPLTKGTNRQTRAHHHRSFTAETRELLDQLSLPYVIEQPVGSGEIRRDLMLCMAYFDLYSGKQPPWVIRHREFELSGFEVRQPRHVEHKGYVRGMRHGVLRDGPYVAAYGNGGGKATVAEMQHALGIDWTDVREELTEAIPPAYTEFIGRGLLDAVSKKVVS